MARRRLEILAHGQKIDSGRAHVVHHLVDLEPLFAEANHDARLGEDRRIELFDLLQQSQRRVVARARADGRIESRHRLKVVVVDVGPRGDDRLDRRLMLVAEVGRQDLNSGVWRVAAQRLDHLDELACPAVGQIVAIDRGDDDMLQPQLGRCGGDMLRLQLVDGARHARLDVAEGAGPGAGIARIITVACFLVQHLHVRAGRFLAHRRQLSSRISRRVS